MVIEEAGTKILTDPGSYTIDAHQQVTGLDAIVITHEHHDHLHVESIEIILQKNPNAVVITNASVAKILKEKGIDCTVVADKDMTTVKSLSIEGFGTEHLPIYETLGLVENTGYLIGGKLYFPGDNFYNPNKKIEVLALPVAGPWMKMSTAIDFAKQIKAKKAFGVHDGMIHPLFRGAVTRFLPMFVPDTEFIEMKDGETKEF